jgi:hypothetical protein
MSLRSEIIKILNEVFADSKKISQLPAAGSLQGSELVEIVQEGVNKKVTVSSLTAGGTVLTWGGFISSSPSLPLTADTEFVASADFNFDGVDIFVGSVLYGPSGAAAVGDFIIKP